MAETDKTITEQSRELSKEDAQYSLSKNRLLSERKKANKSNDKTTVSPLTAALIAGAVGILGTFIGGILNLQVERQKQQGSLILEGIKTGDPKSAARNLLFFSEANLINLSAQQIDALRKEAGDSTLPVLPRPTNAAPQGVVFSPSDNLTPGIKSKVETSLASFQKYLTGVGFNLAGKKISVNINAEEALNVFVENAEGTSTLNIGSSAAMDETAILQQYAFYILSAQREDLSLNIQNVGPGSTDINLANFWWGLADYLNCSYRKDPVVGKILGQMLQTPYLRNLSNQRKFSEIKEYIPPQQAGEVWGGALWEIREIAGQEVADKMLFTVWSQIQKGDNTKKIAQLILESNQSIESGRHIEEIRGVFSRRDLKF